MTKFSTRVTHSAPAPPRPLSFLGIRFWNGKADNLLREMDDAGGLLTVPSAPSLTDALKQARDGQPLLLEAYRQSRWAVVDGGYVALILRWLLRRKTRRISGLKLIDRLFVDDYPAIEMRKRRIVWVVPNPEERQRIAAFLERMHFDARNQVFYEAPFYQTEEDFDDTDLQKLVHSWEPDWVVVCIGGGRQEKLAFFLQQELKKEHAAGGRRYEAEDADQKTANRDSFPEGHPPQATSRMPHDTSPQMKPPAILCTGAAIAFFTGGQVRIPRWADRLYLGWLFRIFENPKLYGKRYGDALFRLPLMLWRYRREW